MPSSRTRRGSVVDPRLTSQDNATCDALTRTSTRSASCAQQGHELPDLGSARSTEEYATVRAIAAGPAQGNWRLQFRSALKRRSYIHTLGSEA